MKNIGDFFSRCYTRELRYLILECVGVLQRRGNNTKMELEDLYKRYCIRLKHSLFVSCLSIGFTGCVGMLVMTMVFSSVSIFLIPHHPTTH